MCRLLLTAIAATALVAAVAGSPASAWTSPTTLSTADEANPARAGGVRRQRHARLVGPDRLAVQAPRPTRTHHHRRPVREGLGRRAEDRDGNAIVAVTVHRHKPVQRIRAIIGGTRRTISDNTHSATQPTLDVAPDGTAVAG